MAKERIKHRKGQVLGTEKRQCNVCNKLTNQQVVYFFAKRSGWIWGGVIGMALTGNAHIAYICSECKTATSAENQNALKEKYGWSNFSGFKGIPKQNIEFIIRK